jgi:hypothetical protein
VDTFQTCKRTFAHGRFSHAGGIPVGLSEEVQALIS